MQRGPNFLSKNISFIDHSFLTVKSHPEFFWNLCGLEFFHRSWSTILSARLFHQSSLINSYRIGLMKERSEAHPRRWLEINDLTFFHKVFSRSENSDLEFQNWIVWEGVSLLNGTGINSQKSYFRSKLLHEVENQLPFSLLFINLMKFKGHSHECQFKSSVQILAQTRQFLSWFNLDITSMSEGLALATWRFRLLPPSSLVNQRESRFSSREDRLLPSTK